MIHDIKDKPADIGSDAAVSVAGRSRLARIARTRWQAMVVLAGVLLTIAGVVLPSGAFLIPGLLLVLFAVFSPATRADSQRGHQPDGRWPWTPWPRQDRSCAAYQAQAAERKPLAAARPLDGVRSHWHP